MIALLCALSDSENWMYERGLLWMSGGALRGTIFADGGAWGAACAGGMTAAEFDCWATAAHAGGVAQARRLCSSRAVRRWVCCLIQFF